MLMLAGVNLLLCTNRVSCCMH